MINKFCFDIIEPLLTMYINDSKFYEQALKEEVHLKVYDKNFEE
jgi:hypothetical protein